MCEILQVSRSGYYAWRQRPVSPREMANQSLLEKIEAAHAASGGRYGSPRIYEEIKDKIPCSLNRVARLMRQALAIRERRLGPNHPDTESSRQSLAVIEARLQQKVSTTWQFWPTIKGIFRRRRG